MKGYIDGILQC